MQGWGLTVDECPGEDSDLSSLVDETVKSSWHPTRHEGNNVSNHSKTKIGTYENKFQIRFHEVY
jgi:hypothetical protein